MDASIIGSAFSAAFMNELEKLAVKIPKTLKYGVPVAAVGIPVAAIYAGSKGTEKGRIEALKEERGY